jgi:hypothetical protein
MSMPPLRTLVVVGACALMPVWPALSAPQETAGKTIAVLEFDLLDDQQALAPATVEYGRLTAIREQLQQALAADGIYRVVDVGPASAMIDGYRSRLQLHACNGCELEIARALHADRVLVGWVQKVSNLILNINVRIEDTASGRVLLVRSVDLRGNTDETWRRGMAYLVRRVGEADPGSR